MSDRPLTPVLVGANDPFGSGLGPGRHTKWWVSGRVWAGSPQVVSEPKLGLDLDRKV